MLNKNKGKGQHNAATWIALPIVAIIFVLLYIIVNLTNITSVVEKINSILSPVFIGLVLAYLLNPIFNLFENKIFCWKKDTLFKRRICRVLSLLCTLIVLAAIIALLILLIVPQLIDSIVEIFNNHEHYINSLVTFANDIINTVAAKFAPEATVPNLSYNDIHNALHSLLSSNNGDENAFIDFLNKYSQEITTIGTDLLVNMVSIFADFIVGLFIAVYLLTSKELRSAQIQKARKALFSKESNKFISEVIYVAKTSFGGYIRGKILSSLMVGIITYIGLLIFDISDYKLLIATIICITDIIPIFGPFIGAIPSAIIVLMCDPSKLLPFILMILIIQQIEGNIISPKILGESTNISSLAVIIAITVMGGLFGIGGMVLGVPIFATVIIIVKIYLEKRLNEKNLPTETEDYMGVNSMSDTDIILHKPDATWINNIKRFFKSRRDKKNASPDTQVMDESPADNVEESENVEETNGSDDNTEA